MRNDGLEASSRRVLNGFEASSGRARGEFEPSSRRLGDQNKYEAGSRRAVGRVMAGSKRFRNGLETVRKVGGGFEAGFARIRSGSGNSRWV